LVAKIALIIVVFLVMLLLKRKTFLYLSASRHIAQATVPEQKDWDKLEKALPWGFPSRCASPQPACTSRRAIGGKEKRSLMR
jgi:hypothetical protein